MKNSKGISLIALIITIIVIIILAAIVIGGVFNTPRDARFAQFCQDFDQIQTSAQLTYYNLYQKDQLDNTDNYYATAAQVVNMVATGSSTLPTAAADPAIAEWVDMTDAGFTLIGVKRPTYSANAGVWKLHTQNTAKAPLCSLIYSAGFEKQEGESYVTPSVLTTAASTSLGYGDE